MSKKEINDLILKYQRTGNLDKARWLETIDKRIPLSFKKRIIENDKTVLRELILPNWLTWEFLRDWAMDDAQQVICSACGERVTEFVHYKQINLCRECLESLTKM